ncbi:hypothetical protein MtrunA17_Chr5g0436611 [Medicago truncatula]|uniref:Uncharacterized protein n=1 Tax=Medicago truncatula TaxID=3880 RepID=A0A396HX56_MEDTR|nr:hypothetical protein MtrunA17_Chr5g0436611 [Medicago truncatula]
MHHVLEKQFFSGCEVQLHISYADNFSRGVYFQHGMIIEYTTRDTIVDPPTRLIYVIITRISLQPS